MKRIVMVLYRRRLETESLNPRGRMEDKFISLNGYIFLKSNVVECKRDKNEDGTWYISIRMRPVGDWKEIMDGAKFEQVMDCWTELEAQLDV